MKNFQIEGVAHLIVFKDVRIFTQLSNGLISLLMNITFPKLNSQFLLIAFSIFSLVFSGFSQTTIPFTSPGTTTWTVPPCVTSITVQTWGGGGGGGGSTSRQGGSGSDWEACSQGGGGGGGGFASRTYTVTPGDVYTVVVGAGGAGGIGNNTGSSSVTTNNGQAGGNSTFSGPATVAPGTLTAFGGGFGGGAWSNNTSGFSHVGSDGAVGTGGAGGINGTTYFQGGNGSTGRHSASCYDVSGGGGGGAGSSGDGGVASSPASCTLRSGGSAGSTDGGAGANGKKLNSYSANREMQNGDIGNAIGGGGSGSMIHLHSWTNTWVTANGGAGARGEVRIIYTATGNVAAQPSVISGTNPLPCGGGTETYSVTNVPGVTYVWSFSGTGTISGTGNSITLTTSTAGTLTVTPTADCEGPPRTLDITIQPLTPGTASLTNSTFCGTGSTQLSLFGSVGNIQWQQSTNGGTTWTDIPGAITNPYTVNGITSTTMYRAVLSSSGCTAVNSNAVTITLTTSSTPSVTIQMVPNSPICAGTTVTFTAIPVNGGTTPTYQWQINGVNVPGETGVTFSSSTLSNNDVVTVNMVSNGTCLTTPNATASTPAISITNSQTPSVTISGTPTTNICTASSVTFTANPTNGGVNPTYQWQINGVNVPGETNVTFTTTSFLNNDVITVVLTSNASCLTTPTATANTPAILVGGTILPSVVITGSPTSPICNGITVTFTANPTNGGANPTYQWQINGVAVPGQTGVTFTTSSLNNNDVVTVSMVSNDPCVTSPNTNSLGVTIQIGGTLIPTVLISGTPTGIICSGTAITFTANPTNGGTNPTYQWQINGVNVPGAIASTFASNSLNNDDVVSVILTSNDPCADPLIANDVTNQIKVQDLLTPTVLISSSTPPVCPGDPFVFNFSSTNQGSSPTYQWQVNGVSVNGATNATFSSNNLLINDLVSVVLTSNATCLTSNLASNSLSVLQVSDQEFEFVGEFPNVITPNNDGLNDVLDLDSYFSSCIEYQLLILNRWGNTIYTQQKGDKPFEGKDLSGKDLLDGVYFYKLAINQKVSYGFISIVR